MWPGSLPYGFRPRGGTPGYNSPPTGPSNRPLPRCRAPRPDIKVGRVTAGSALGLSRTVLPAPE
ncbi:hypothetical protein GCM10010233_25870 [Streptomyces pseudogriseolus]|uniref:Uncharacterized protein n=1 Tax=Streptomyces pseudogriseolus TaxID=36817 RepID=A0ABQ2T966_STREZ|nr:hypothetical protein GCM10010233_25870 [Streptomyces gancidicus]GGS58853.1 hypothetical protein GCM10010285_42820 [Streptomyces rubiginosus]